MLLSSFKQVLEVALYVLLPRTCYACRRDLPLGAAGPLCQDCQAAVQHIGLRYCVSCGKPLPDGGAHCARCRREKKRSRKCALLRSAVVFGPQVRAVVHAFKYADQSYLASCLAQCMAQYWTAYPELARGQLLVPVPLHSRKLKARGYNQSELLARSLGKQLHLPVNTSCLVRVRNTPSQTTFGREGRLQNMLGAFAVTEPQLIKGKTLVLIDDVATTGATLEGCAAALRAAGAKEVMAYTLAREI